MMKFAKVVRNFIPAERAEEHAVRMDETMKIGVEMRDNQSPMSPAWYSLHTDLLEDCCEKMEDLVGMELAPTYDYSRFYPHGATLPYHNDRPSCEISVTINLRNKGGLWTFYWEGGSVDMEPGDAVVYTGNSLPHWRDDNPAEETHQVFLHYVDPTGPYAARADEYLRRKPSHMHALLGSSMPRDPKN